MFLAFVEGYWFHGLVAEVFSLNHLFVVGLFLIAFLPESFSKKHLFWMAFLGGVGVGHHHLIVLLGPPLAWYVFRKNKDLFRVQPIVLSLLIFVAGVFVFSLLLPIRASFDPAVNWGDATTFSGWWHLITRGDYGGLGQATLQEGQNAFRPRSEQLVFFIKSIWRQWTPLGVGFLILGLWQLRKKALLFQTILLGLLLSGPLLLLYANIPLTSRYNQAGLERFLLINFFWLTLPVGFGMGWFVQKLKPVRLGWGVSLACLFLLFHHGPTVDQSNNRLAYHHAEDMLSGSEPGSLVLVSGDDASFGLEYMDAVEDRLEGRKVIHVAMLSWPWYEKQIRDRYPDIKLFPRKKVGDDSETIFLPWDLVRENIQNQPVFVSPRLIETDAKLAESYYFEPTKLLVRVSDRPDFNIARFATRSDEFLKGDWVQGFHSRHGKRPVLETRVLVGYLKFLIQMGSLYELTGYNGDSEIVFEKAIELAKKVNSPSLAGEIQQLVNRATWQARQAREKGIL